MGPAATANELRYSGLALSFFLPGEDLAARPIDELLASDDVWEHYLGVLQACKAADFSRLSDLVPLMQRHDSSLFWSACADLLGCAGSWEQVLVLVDMVATDPRLFVDAADALTASCDLRAIEPLLALHARCTADDLRIDVERAITRLLDADAVQVWRAEDHGDAYVPFVRDQLARARASAGCDRPVWGGRLFDVAELARSIRERLDHPNANDWIDREERVFEAATGVDCSSLLVNLYRPRAIATLDAFLAGPVTRFERGTRYFFGHQLPAP